MHASTKQPRKTGIALSQALTLVLMLILLVLTGATFYYVAIHKQYDEQYRIMATDQQLLVQQVARTAADVFHGGNEVFQTLKSKKNDFEDNLGLLKQGNSETGLPPTPEAVLSELLAIQKRWKNIRENVDTILSSAEDLSTLREVGAQIQERAIPETIRRIDELVNSFTDKNLLPVTNYATKTRLLAEHVANLVNRVLLPGGDPRILKEINQNLDLLTKTVEGMQKGDELLKIPALGVSFQDKLVSLLDHLKILRALSDRFAEKVALFPKVQKAAKEIDQQADPLAEDLTKLLKSYGQYTESRTISSLTGYLLGVGALLLLVWLGVGLLRDVRVRQQESEKQQKLAAESNRRNQDAILRLLEEITNLADGDLTVKASVTEDFTGAIADSINYAVDALRELVSAINTTTLQVSGAAQETQSTAMHLAEASEHQAQEIRRASATVDSMAHAMEQTANQADSAVSVAQNSVLTAKNGAGAVRDTIQEMDAIGKQIEETSKRIGQLQGASQEIGEVTNLINDISDQTNILALNAAIQAAMAGEAGRGFAVVADEVQHLAERAGDATKRIDALIRGIQNDASNTVNSMQETIANVSRGAKTAEKAGKSLSEIEGVSGQLAELIQKISQAAQAQVRSAVHISETMNIIQEITTQTSTGTQDTAASIGHLADLSNELRRSVAGFTLPT
ncbi:Protein PilJ [Gammaproteobacteria bacterium]